MCSPEAVQQIQGYIRQRNQTIFVSFGVADVDTPISGINIAYPKTQAFTESQTKTIDGEIKHPVTENGGSP